MDNFISYVCEQMADAGVIIYKKMFGAYCVYCNSKAIGFVCDGQLFIKPTEAGKRLIQTPEMASPYPGAKSYFLIAEIDNREFLSRLAYETAMLLPEPKRKKIKSCLALLP